MKTFFVLIMLLSLTILISCSESTGPENNVDLKIYTNLSNNVVSSIKSDGKTDILANEIDSIIITRTRILISNIKLHLTSSPEEDNKLVKVGPALFVGDASPVLLGTVNIPVGNYNKIKFELHRFESSVLPNYANDSLFKNFATPDRYSVIIDCIFYVAGIPTQFTYNATVTANLTVNFSDSKLIDGNEILMLSFSPNDVFKSGSKILDPTDSKNQNDIDNAIKSAFKATILINI